MRVRPLAVAGLVLLLGPPAVAGCTGPEPATPDRLVIAAGPEGEVSRVLGEALGEAARRAWGADVSVTGQYGSVENLEKVANREADVGFATVDAAQSLHSGDGPFDPATSIRALARLYDDYLQLVTLAGTGVDELADLSGQRVSVGHFRSGTNIPVDRVLEAAGVRSVDREDQSTEPAAALRNEEIVAFFVAGGLPTPAVTELAGQPGPPPVLLPLQHLIPALQQQHGEYYYQARSIPARTYPKIDTTVGTVGIPILLVVREDLPDDTAYQLTRLLFGAQPELVAAHPEARRLDPRSAVATFPVELHPGAERYYRDEKPLALYGTSR